MYTFERFRVSLTVYGYRSHFTFFRKLGRVLFFCLLVLVLSFPGGPFLEDRFLDVHRFVAVERFLDLLALFLGRDEDFCACGFEWAWWVVGVLLSDPDAGHVAFGADSAHEAAAPDESTYDWHLLD